MATKLGAGKYTFGKNLPMGSYDLAVVSGSGMLYIEKEDDGVWSEDFGIYFGTEEEDARSYNGLSLPKGKYFRVTGNVVFEISKATKIKID